MKLTHRGIRPTFIKWLIPTVAQIIAQPERRTLRRWFEGFRPAAAGVSRTEQLRGAVGALVGILCTGFVSSWIVGTSFALPLLIAPMGASAVLLFAVPSSPLAQPWSIVGGNLAAAFVGVTAARLIHDPLSAASVAVGVTIGIMFVLRCVHPPSGAVALTAVLGGPAVTKLGYAFVLSPVLLNSFLLMLVALAFNNATRRSYPHAQLAKPENPHGTRDASPIWRLGFSSGDLDAVLKRYDQVLDISRPDIGALFQAAEMESWRRRYSHATCAEIMSHDVVSVEWGTPLEEAWTLMRRRRLRSVPVVDKARRVVGLLSDLDFLRDFGLHSYPSVRSRFLRLVRPVASDFPGAPEVVGQIMITGVPTANAATSVVDLVPLLADSRLRHVPIIDEQRRLVGIVSQSDLIGALYQTSLHQD